jgi:hypothetical protein
MEPNTVGRKFGIGVRVASKMVLDRAARSSPPSPAAQGASSQPPLSQVYAQRGKAVASGARRFGGAIWTPFAHASGIIWLQITGLFFSLFAIVFASNAYKLRQDWAAGPGHARFLTYCAVTLLFAWFACSSFYRAGKKQRRGHRS